MLRQSDSGGELEKRAAWDDDGLLDLADFLDPEDLDNGFQNKPNEP